MEKLNKIFKNSAKYFFFVLLAYLVVTCFLRGISRDLDFQVFHKVATRIAQGDLNIYDFTQDGIFSYKYTPTAALLFFPLSLLPKFEMQKIWSFLNVFCTFLSFYLSYLLAIHWLPQSQEKKKNYLILGFTLLMLSPYYVNNAMQGNINSMIYFLIVGSLYFSVVRKMNVLPAILISIAIIIKIIPVTILCFFLFTKRYRVFFLSLLLVFVGMTLPFLVWGKETTFILYSGWNKVIHDTSHFPFLKWTNQSPSVVFFKMSGSEAAYKISPFIHFIALSAMGLWALIKKNEALLFVTATMSMLWLSPIVWLEYYLCLATLLFIITSEALSDKASKTWKIFFWLRFAFLYATGKFLIGKEAAEFLANNGIHYWGGVFLVLLIIFIPFANWKKQAS